MAFSGTKAQEPRQLSAEAEALLQCFREIYGEKTISGTIANVNWNINEAKWVYQHTGQWPALNFFDFIHLPFSPANWIDYSNVTEVVNWHKNGGIVGCMWHWNMPTNAGHRCEADELRRAQDLRAGVGRIQADDEGYR